MARASQVFTIIFTLIAALIVFIVLMTYSFDVVSPLSVGVLYNSATRQVDTPSGYIYLPGRYYVGPGKEFIEIPTRRLNIVISDENVEIKDADFTSGSLLARTKDGLQIKVDIFCQIKLIDASALQDATKKATIEKSFLRSMQNLNLYNSKNGYLEILTSILKTEVLDAVSLFQSEEIYTKRSQLRDQLMVQFQESMAEFQFTVPVLILTNVAFTSNAINDAIETTQILNQNVLQMLILENSKKLQLSYLQQVNQFDNQNAVNSATTQAQVNMIKTNGTANGVNLAYNNLLAGFKDMQTFIGKDFTTMNFMLYLAIFKNTFSSNQTVLLTNAGFF